jgi:phosphatidylserine/phosphatidylglycerophosphate/cardiolipin synthase-like enzyme
LLLAILLLGCVFAFIKVVLLADTIAQEPGDIQVTFCRTDDCAAAFTEALAGARGARCAFYELNHEGIAAALDSAGAEILVFDEEPDVPAAVADQVALVPSPGLMHHKFCVLDDDRGVPSRVITGSMNPTVNDVTRNDNNLLVITSRTMASRYDAEYAALASRENAGDLKTASKPVTVNLTMPDGRGVLLTVRFCPQEQCEETMVSLLGNARSSLDFALFTFTSDPVGQAMLDAARRGVNVSGVVEHRQSDTYSEHVRLQDAGLPVVVDGNPGTMHHKVVVVDGHLVLTGSFNPTKSATTKNDENLLIINDPVIAALYTAELSRVMAVACDAGRC